MTEEVIQQRHQDSDHTSVSVSNSSTAPNIGETVDRKAKTHERRHTKSSHRHSRRSSRHSMEKSASSVGHFRRSHREATEPSSEHSTSSLSSSSSSKHHHKHHHKHSRSKHHHHSQRHKSKSSTKCSHQPIQRFKEPTKQRRLPHMKEPTQCVYTIPDLFDNGPENSPSRESLLRLMSHLKHEGRLSMSLVVHLFTFGTKVMTTEATVLDVPEPAVVIGDLHGQLFDLIHIIGMIGLPGENQTILSRNMKQNNDHHEARTPDSMTTASEDDLSNHETTNGRVHHHGPPRTVGGNMHAIFGNHTMKSCVSASPNDDSVITGGFSNESTDSFSSFSPQGALPAHSAPVLSSSYKKNSCDRAVTYVFLGDYVDRGLFSLETLFLVVAMKLTYPDHVALLRGNHESLKVNTIFNFLDEIRAKLQPGEDEDSIHAVLNALYISLPVAAVIGEHFLCLHGGITPQAPTLDHIRKINRFERENATILNDIVWSDPAPSNIAKTLNFCSNVQRGTGYLYGHQALVKFLTNSKLLCLVRAHEVQKSGFGFGSPHPVSKFPTFITVFSAPNYVGTHGNRGAFLIIDQKKLRVKQVDSSPAPFVLADFSSALTWSVPFVFESFYNLMEHFLTHPAESRSTSPTEKDQRKRKHIEKVKKLTPEQKKKLKKVLKKKKKRMQKLKKKVKKQLPVLPIGNSPDAEEEDLSETSDYSDTTDISDFSDISNLSEMANDFSDVSDVVELRESSDMEDFSLSDINNSLADLDETVYPPLQNVAEIAHFFEQKRRAAEMKPLDIAKPTRTKRLPDLADLREFSRHAADFLLSDDRDQQKAKIKAMSSPRGLVSTSTVDGSTSQQSTYDSSVTKPSTTENDDNDFESITTWPCKELTAKEMHRFQDQLASNLMHLQNDIDPNTSSVERILIGNNEGTSSNNSTKHGTDDDDEIPLAKVRITDIFGNFNATPSSTRNNIQSNNNSSGSNTPSIQSQSATLRNSVLSAHNSSESDIAAGKGGLHHVASMKEISQIYREKFHQLRDSVISRVQNKHAHARNLRKQSEKALTMSQNLKTSAWYPQVESTAISESVETMTDALMKSMDDLELANQINNTRTFGSRFSSPSPFSNHEHVRRTTLADITGMITSKTTVSGNSNNDEQNDSVYNNAEANPSIPPTVAPHPTPNDDEQKQIILDSLVPNDLCDQVTAMEAPSRLSLDSSFQSTERQEREGTFDRFVQSTSASPSFALSTVSPIDEISNSMKEPLKNTTISKSVKNTNSPEREPRRIRKPHSRVGPHISSLLTFPFSQTTHPGLRNFHQELKHEVQKLLEEEEKIRNNDQNSVDQLSTSLDCLSKPRSSEEEIEEVETPKKTNVRTPLPEIPQRKQATLLDRVKEQKQDHQHLRVLERASEKYHSQQQSPSSPTTPSVSKITTKTLEAVVDNLSKQAKSRVSGNSEPTVTKRRSSVIFPRRNSPIASNNNGTERSNPSSDDSTQLSLVPPERQFTSSRGKLSRPRSRSGLTQPSRGKSPLQVPQRSGSNSRTRSVPKSRKSGSSAWTSMLYN